MFLIITLNVPNVNVLRISAPTFILPNVALSNGRHEQREEASVGIG